MVDASSLDELPPDIRWMRRGAFALLLLGLLLLVGLASWKLLQSPRLDWRQLRIEGDVTRNSQATLRANVLPRVHGNFFSTRLGDVQAAFKAVPWVREASVRRVWPGQLLVQLEEHRAVASWDGRGEYGEPPLERALLNSHGEVFHANLGEVEDDNLPQLAGPSGSEAQVLQMWRRLSGIAAARQRELQRLELSGRGSWRLTLDAGAVVELGRGDPDPLADRFERFLPHALAVAQRFQTQLQSADLRHPGGYALKLVGIATRQTAESVKRKPPRKP